MSRAQLLTFSRNQAALTRLATVILGRHFDRIIISGGPRAGKSTLAAKLNDGRHSVHDGEELVGGDWSAGSLAASLWLDEPGPWICENVAMARAIRKWLARNPTRSFPADLVIHLSCQVAARSPGQTAMAKGCETVWRQVQPELIKRGVRVIETNPGAPITLESLSSDA